MTVPPVRISTGNVTLDAALGGGVRGGSTLLVEGWEGAGATEFALTLLRSAVRAKAGRKARFLSALRSPARVEREIGDLFEDPKLASAIEVRPIRPHQAQTDCMNALSDLGAGDAIAIESTAALSRAEAARDLALLVQSVGNVAHEVGAVVLLLHAPATLPSATEAALAEAADGLLVFGWRDAQQTRRRILTLPKMRGLAPVLDNEQVPVFEVALQRGVGFSISSVRNVV